MTKKEGEKKLKGKNTKARRRKILSRAWAFTHMMHDETREQIITGLMERYGYAKESAISIYEDTVKRVTNRLCMEANTIYDRNLNRLETMIDDSIDDDDMGNALKAIQEQNKMIGVGDKRNITIQNGEDSQEFKIKIED